jgi:hypothetical protein
VVAPRWNQTDAKKITALLLRGLSVDEVAAATGFTTHSVQACGTSRRGHVVVVAEGASTVCETSLGVDQHTWRQPLEMA